MYTYHMYTHNSSEMLVGIYHGLAHGAVVGHAITHEWGRDPHDWPRLHAGVEPQKPCLLVPNHCQFPFYQDHLSRDH